MSTVDEGTKAPILGQLPDLGIEYEVTRILDEIREADEDLEQVVEEVKDFQEKLIHLEVNLENANQRLSNFRDRRLAWAMELQYTIGQATRPERDYGEDVR